MGRVCALVLPAGEKPFCPKLIGGSEKNESFINKKSSQIIRYYRDVKNAQVYDENLIAIIGIGCISE
jgi:hypothetical protein